MKTNHLCCCRHGTQAVKQTARVALHRGNKRKLEVSPLAEDRRRVSQRLNPEPDITVPRTRAAASIASPAVHRLSTAGKGKQPDAKVLSALPQSRNAARHHGNVTADAVASHTAGEAAKTRQAKPASHHRAAATTTGAHLASPEAVTGAGGMAEATRQAAALKSQNPSGKFVKGSTSRATAQEKLVSHTGQGRSVPNSKQHKTRQAADRIARSSTLRGRLQTSRPNVQLAVAKPAVNASRSRLTQNSTTLASGTAGVAAGKGAESAAGTRARRAALAMGASLTTTVTAASLKLLQEAAAAGKLGCPKCRYCMLRFAPFPFSMACLTPAVLAFRGVAALHSIAAISSCPHLCKLIAICLATSQQHSNTCIRPISLGNQVGTS